ncbi:MAG TPA: ABC transporter substrate-binding protein [candidate division Zixibacteria bacterium]|nr:ABC transporter substrate-binding protein [candidate division Zixibacteria bacterium]
MAILDSLRAELAPTGTLRAGINYGNPVLARRDPRSGELSGIAVVLARELARRAELPLKLVGYESAGKMFAAFKQGAWDIAFLALDAERANEIDFTAPYLEIEGAYLVPAGSPLRAPADVDRDGTRIAVSAGSAYDLFLTRSLKHAVLVRAPTPDAAFALAVAREVDAVAGVRQHLLDNAPKLPGSRVLDGRFMAIEQALGLPKGRPQARDYLCEFVEEMKACGLIARAIEEAGLRGVTVAPKAR